ncbi:hypothetical protein MOMOMM191B_11380 [Morganella morganii]
MTQLNNLYASALKLQEIMNEINARAAIKRNKKAA